MKIPDDTNAAELHGVWVALDTWVATSVYVLEKIAPMQNTELHAIWLPIPPIKAKINAGIKASFRSDGRHQFLNASH